MKPFKRSGKFGKRDSFQSTHEVRFRGKDRPPSSRPDSRSFEKKERFGDRGPEKFERQSSGPRDSEFRPFEEGKKYGKAKPTRGGFELFETTCDKCGRKCDVPFKPTGGKPVYCRSCFRGGEGPETSSRPAERFDSGRSNDRTDNKNDSVSREEINQINKKLDKIMKALKIE